MKRYFPNEIEPKWQKVWQEEGINDFKSSFAKASKGKYYNLVELAYPSGDLHLGHWFAFIPADAHARYKKMNGFNVFFPNGFDAFGLPAENAAIKRGVHPKDWTMKNIEVMKKQFATMGTMIDWHYTAITCQPEYYRWNQWIFLKMFEKGIAYRGKTLSNWCPQDQTVLANEHIENGKCWRCGSEVIQKEVEQWFLAITKYADKLIWPTRLASESAAGWPKIVTEGQNNWIGRSEGLLIKFEVIGGPVPDFPPTSTRSNETSLNHKSYIEVFTTRPETADGATFLVVAPEHEFVSEILNSELSIKNKELRNIQEYVGNAQKKTERERKEDRTKSGVFTGRYVMNPVTGKDIPVWISDYVLAGYGTGAIMAVPFADERDREFAERFNLTILETSFKAKPKGTKTAHYHLRDWSVSRQRYWGTPVPIIYCKNCALQPRFSDDARQTKPQSGLPCTIIDGEEYAIVPVPLEDLPLELPYNVDYAPKGQPPLATDEEWLKVKCPRCGGEARRDAETLDTFFDSSWYFYRYVSPHFKKGPFNEKQVGELMPVDVYFGGAEHTVGHALYSRFFTKFFKDLGLIGFDEFALKRVQHGVILGPDGNRMSKSKGNVVNPDDVVKEYGADTVRLYLCFMMPYEATSPWSTGAISGIYRFLKRVWELSDKIVKTDLSASDLTQMHKTIKKVGDDLNNFQFNTAVASLMSWLNYLSAKTVSKEEYDTFLKLMAPFAPHIAEELYHLDNESANSIHLEKWPQYRSKYLIEENVPIVVQVNGKLRATIIIQNSESETQNGVEEAARRDEKIKKYLEGKQIKKVIYVKGKLLNFVV